MKKLIYSSLIAVLLPCFCLKNANAQQKTDSTVYEFLSMESPPMYPGGMSSLYKFLGENIKYPADALVKDVQGKVMVSFVVEKDGTLNDFKVERKLGGGTDEEAIRVLKLTKRWNPGMQNGKAVRVKYNIPIKFTKSNSKEMSATQKTVDIPGENNTVDNVVYSFVSFENPPQYNGGMPKLYEFINKNLKYPTLAVENKIQGKVVVSFIVEKDGTLSEIKVDQKLGYGTDEEAIRVLKLSEKWNPGLIDGKTARVKFNIPIKFVL